MIGSRLCGTCAHAVSKIAATQANGKRIMWIVVIEIAFALGLAVFIVWWTWPRKRPEGGEKERGKRSDDQ
jgi:hypothetical protein